MGCLKIILITVIKMIVNYFDLVHSPRVGGLGHVDAVDTHLVCNITKRLDALFVWLLVAHLQSGDNTILTNSPENEDKI